MDKKKMKIKEELLDELIDKMKEAEAMGLKKPKVAKVDIESNDPELAEEIKNKMIGGMVESDMEDEMEEMPMESMDEEEFESEEESEMGYESDDDDDLERLKKLYRKIK